MKKIRQQYRQGDVLLNPIKTIPAGAKRLPDQSKVVLAEGEATGHEHAIRYKREQLQVFTDKEQLYLRVKKPIRLEHQEHAEITVEPGDYAVLRQVEVWLDEVRQVAD